MCPRTTFAFERDLWHSEHEAPFPQPSPIELEQASEQGAAFPHALSGPVGKRPQRGVKMWVTGAWLGIDRHQHAARIANQEVLVLRIAMNEGRGPRVLRQGNSLLLSVLKILRRDPARPLTRLPFRPRKPSSHRRAQRRQADRYLRRSELTQRVGDPLAIRLVAAGR
jgi:hypothetical protein